MSVKYFKVSALVLVLALMTVAGWAQSLRGSLSGTVADPSGAMMPNVGLTLTNIDTGFTATATTGPDGLYSFPNLQAGNYELKATASGFRDFVQRGISILVNQSARLELKLELGAETQTVEVLANASPLDFETGTRQEGIAPETIQQLPILLGGKPRSAASFAILMPGVSTGGRNDAFDSRINGGLASGDEAIVDGVSMQQGMMSQTGMISIHGDFQYTPDMVSEVKVLTANYEPQYGATTSAVIIANTKSGTNEFHGGGYWFHRNTVLNARQFGADTRPVNLQNNPGGYIGGPVRWGDKNIPGIWSDKRKSYFYVNFEAFRIAGGATRETISIPSLKNRNGDFSDWRDSETGNLIPIFDPATTRIVNGEVVRDQFMGCNGNTPNVICPDRIQNSLAKQWFSFLPTPTNDGAINNYLIPTPIPDVLLGRTNNWLIKGDHYVGERDHFSGSMYYQGAAPQFNCRLPVQICEEVFTAPQYSFVNRFNWDHTFSPTLLNHFAGGYLDRFEGYGSINAEYANELPQIAGVASNNYPSVITFSDDFQQFGNNAGINTKNVTSRPSYIVNDLVTWVKGRHTFKFGGEYRNLGENNRTNTNESGTFDFGRGATGLRNINSGSPIASFLLEAVDNANVDFRTVSSWYPRSDAWIFHFGDTLKVTPKLTINYGVRWDMFRPSVEKWDRTSFFDLIGPNPAAGGRPGRLAFAGSGYGAASFGDRHPEETFHKGFAPRLGIAYSLSPKTVIRTGYGLFYAQAYYPGWGGGINRDGFDTFASFSSSQGGLQPAFLLSQGFPQNFTRPPSIDGGARNGQNVNYRPFDANRLPYSQQWNLTIEHELQNRLVLSLAYVANKGTRVPSNVAHLNALDPRLLSMGNQLFDEFQPGQTELHGVSIPYAGWREQMTGCAPSVAQALLPYPQFCDDLNGLNENAGNSTYHSFQVKAEKRFSNGTFLLASYTLSKLLTTSDQTNQGAEALNWSGASGVISPFERQRNKALAVDDVPQVFSVAFVYDLPFGAGKRFASGSGVSNKILGGWQVSGTYRASSGLPFFFRSTQCNVPEQFRIGEQGCIPAIKPGANPFAQDKDNFDVNKPLFNRDAFEPIESFNFYYGVGPRISNVRGFAYQNTDFAIFKNIGIGESVRFQFRAEFFNLFNWHIFNTRGSGGSDSHTAFVNDLASPDFGMWNGNVSPPRNIQFGVRLEF